MFDRIGYNRAWMENYRRKKRDFTAENRDKLIAEGKCTTCEMLLTSQYHTKYPCKK